MSSEKYSVTGPKGKAVVTEESYEGERDYVVTLYGPKYPGGVAWDADGKLSSARKIADKLVGKRPSSRRNPQAEENPAVTNLLLAGLLGLGVYWIFFRQEEEEEVESQAVLLTPDASISVPELDPAQVAVEAIQALGSKVISVESTQLLSGTERLKGRKGPGALRYTGGRAWLVKMEITERRSRRQRGWNRHSAMVLVRSDGSSDIVDYVS